MSALALAGVGVRLGGRAVVSDVTLDLAGGRLVAVVGPNGAGKTSLLRAIACLVPRSGTIRLDGVDLGTLAPSDRARRIAYLPQGHEAHWPLPAHDVVALGRVPHGARDPLALDPADRLAVADAMQVTETGALAERAITTLSGGERARVALARVFAVGAPVILADEPTAALDPRHQLDVMGALRRRAEDGALVLAVTHDVGLAARFADVVVVLQEGRVAAFGPPRDALGPAILSGIFGVAAYTAEHEGAPVVVPWS